MANTIGDATNPDKVQEREDRPKPESDKQLEQVVQKTIKFSNRCNICKHIRADKRLRKRIHNSRAYIPHSKDSPRKIYMDMRAQGLACTYPGLLNHIKKHDPPVNTPLGKELAKELIKKKIVLEKRELTTQEHEEPVKLWQSIIKNTNIDLESENLTPSIENALKAAKDYTDYMNKQKDQNMAAAKMIWQFASGQDADTLSDKLEGYTISLDGEKITEHTATDTRESSEDSEAGEERSDPVYNGTAGDAATRWPSEIPNGSTGKKS